MKHMKKMMAMFLAIIMVVVLAVPAFAAESKTYTITINNDKDDHTYEAYQVFSGDLSENVLSNIQWGTGVNGDALLTALKEGDAFENAFDNCTTAAQVAEVLASFESNSTELDAFATVVGDSVYVSGYDMWSNAGGWLAALDKETLTAHTVYSVFRGGNMATTWGGTVVDGNRYLMLGRGRMQSASTLFEVTGVGTVGIKGNDWECLAVGFTLPGVNADDPGSGTGIVPTSTPDNNLHVWTASGCLTVLADEPCQVRVLNVTGAAVATFEADSHATTVPLSQGLYIVNGQKVIIR